MPSRLGVLAVQVLAGQMQGAGANLGNLMPVSIGGQMWLKGSLGLPDAERMRALGEMEGVIQRAAGLLNEFKSFSLRHPSRGTPLYHHLALDSMQTKHTLEYFAARAKTVRIAENVLPSVSSFISTKAQEAVLAIQHQGQVLANKHIQDIADRPALSCVLLEKWRLLIDRMQAPFAALASGPRISEADVTKVLSKKPVDARGFHASVEALKNLHYVDEYQVVCAVTSKFAEHADQYSMEEVSNGLSQLVGRQEHVQIPMEPPEL